MKNFWREVNSKDGRHMSIVFVDGVYKPAKMLKY